MQERILNEVSDLVSIVNRKIDDGLKEHNMAGMLELRIGSVINSLLFGYRFDQEHIEEFHIVKNLMSTYVKLAGDIPFRIAQSNSNLFLRVPFIREHVEKTQSCAQQLIKFFQHQIQEHEAQCDYKSGAPPEDFVEAFLRKQHEETGNTNYNNYQLTHVIYDLWLAGLF